MALSFIEVTYENLETAVEIQNRIFPGEDGRQNDIDGIAKRAGIK